MVVSGRYRSHKLVIFNFLYPLCLYACARGLLRLRMSDCDYFPNLPKAHNVEVWIRCPKNCEKKHNTSENRSDELTSLMLGRATVVKSNLENSQEMFLTDSKTGDPAHMEWSLTCCILSSFRYTMVHHASCLKIRFTCVIAQRTLTKAGVFEWCWRLCSLQQNRSFCYVILGN